MQRFASSDPTQIVAMLPICNKTKPKKSLLSERSASANRRKRVLCVSVLARRTGVWRHRKKGV